MNLILQKINFHLMKLNIFTTSIILLVLLISCEKETEFELPLVLTGEVTEINKEGAKFNGKISNLPDTEILEYGFVWDNVKNPTIENAQKYIVYNTPVKGTFKTLISTTLKENVNYYVRAFIRSNSSVIYGNNVSFNSKGSVAPIINTIFPKSGNLDDTILIVGENFSYKNDDNKVFFGEFPSTLIKAKQDTLWVIVPSKLNYLNSTVSVTILENKAVAPDKFNLIPPVINDFYNKSGTYGSQITIAGDNFKSNPKSLKVFFAENAAKIIELNNQSMVIVVPDSLNYRNSKIRVEMNNITASKNEDFTLDNLEVKDFTPKVSITGEKITLHGNNFSPVAVNNQVIIGGITAEVINANMNELEVIIPTQEKNYYPAREVTIEVTVAAQVRNYNELLLINDKWFRLPNAPVQEPYNLINVTKDGLVYIGLNNTIQFWSFNTQTQQWQRLPDFPGKPRASGTAFVLNNKIYFGTGSINYEPQNDIWEYDITNKTWTQKNEFPGIARFCATSFSINNNGYIVAGGVYTATGYSHPYDDCWEYEPNSDSWTKLQGVNYPNQVELYGFYDATAITIGNTALFGIGWNWIAYPTGYHERMYVFNPDASVKWTQIESFPEKREDRSLSFIWNEVPVFYANKTFYIYNIKSNSWTPLFESILNSEEFHYGLAFASEKKIFLGCGRTNQMWEYDINRE